MWLLLLLFLFLLLDFSMGKPAFGRHYVISDNNDDVVMFQSLLSFSLSNFPFRTSVSEFPLPNFPFRISPSELSLRNLAFRTFPSEFPLPNLSRMSPAELSQPVPFGTILGTSWLHFGSCLDHLSLRGLHLGSCLGQERYER